jgi:hypothetical protein
MRHILFNQKVVIIFLCPTFAVTVFNYALPGITSVHRFSIGRLSKSTNPFPYGLYK